MSYHCYFDCLVLHILDSILCECVSVRSAILSTA